MTGCSGELEVGGHGGLHSVLRGHGAGGLPILSCRRRQAFAAQLPQVLWLDYWTPSQALVPFQLPPFCAQVDKMTGPNDPDGRAMLERVKAVII